MAAVKKSKTEEESTFASIAQLDTRVLRALADQAFVKPTLVQAKAIPLALEGKDILCRARTGSGKTVAYCVPVLERILAARKVANNTPEKQATRAVILVPTRELAEQVTGQLKKLGKYCEEVIVANMMGSATNHLNKMLLNDKPDIVVGTPAKVLSSLQSKSLILELLEILVIDEADLILSYGHAQTMNTLLSSTVTSMSEPSSSTALPATKTSANGYLPAIYQSLLMSATLTADVKTLKSLVLRNPAILTLTEEEAEDSENLLSQYVLHLPTETEKFLHIYVILKLKLIKGKAILFVNDVERCYRLKLFLEQFSVRCCVLNRELPINSRYHTIQEFNKGIYDYIIATDESGGKNEEVDSASEQGEVEDESKQEEDADFAETQRKVPTLEDQVQDSTVKTKKRKHDESDEEMEDASGAHPSKKRQKNENNPKGGDKKSAKKAEKEYSTSRGIDFVDVACVVNFDLPLSHRSYVHRVGRTARAGRGGVAISFVVSSTQGEKKPKGHKGGTDAKVDEEKIWRKIERKQNHWTKEIASTPADQRPESRIKIYTLSPSLLSGFRYRMEDALRSVTGKAVKEARIKELKNEILNSGKLKAHFEDNPLDLEYLRHDKPLHPARVQTHMKYIPSYLLPKGVNPNNTTTVIDQDGGQEKFDGAIASGVISAEMESAQMFVPFNKRGQNRGRGRGRGRGGFGSRGRGGGSRHGAKRKNDPLKKFGA
ncbi:hypothetical protein M408DRAFT_325874 [Serendipita vermifera MAFF 305830]|uniref:RNA helicase n=1 Tax=Serendipita vermifera MAFF 305830 TaxID=933852 RepID=A0A0C3BQV8_SERVB|nr:hypothetical protein M408DRAFT_325874 [Serendipita vermifera MAFF 305830]